MLIGIETGGTKIVCSAGTSPQDVVDVATVPTQDPTSTLQSVTAFVTRWQQEAGLEGVGIGSFGPVDLDPCSRTYGHLLQTPKLAWRGVDVVGPIAQAAGAPVAIETDVTAAAIGELHWGAGRGLTDLAYATVGTGVGVGAVVQGHALHGTAHPEAGHLTVRRHPDDDFAGVCPLHGDCLEGLASGPAVAARWGRPGAELGELRERAVQIEASYLAQLVTTLVYVLSPARIVLGGGVLGTPGLLEAVRVQAATLLAGALGEHPASDPTSEFLSLPGLGGRSGAVGALTMAAGVAGPARTDLTGTARTEDLA